MINFREKAFQHIYNTNLLRYFFNFGGLMDNVCIHSRGSMRNRFCFVATIHSCCSILHTAPMFGTYLVGIHAYLVLLWSIQQELFRKRHNKELRVAFRFSIHNCASSASQRKRTIYVLRIFLHKSC